MQKNKFSQLLKKTIMLYNINCIEFADEIGVSESTIRQWQNGRNFPSKSALDHLYNSLKEEVNRLTDPSLSSQMSGYISELIPANRKLTKSSKDNTGEMIVDALKICYANERMHSAPAHYDIYPTIDKTQVVVFDFDGTLTKSHVTKTTWETIWIALGYDVEECRALHRKFDANEITHEEWCKLTTEKFLAKRLHISTINKIATEIQLIDGCKEVFRRLKDLNIKIYIVSGSILSIIQNVLCGLTMYVDLIKANDFKFSQNGFFYDIVGTEYDFEGKAKFVREIAEKLKISTGDILFVGNSYNDKFVHESGAKTICINPKNTDPSNRIIWNECIQECANLTQVLSFVKT